MLSRKSSDLSIVELIREELRVNPVIVADFEDTFPSGFILSLNICCSSVANFHRHWIHFDFAIIACNCTIMRYLNPPDLSENS